MAETVTEVAADGAHNALAQVEMLVPVRQTGLHNSAVDEEKF